MKKVLLLVMVCLLGWSLAAQEEISKHLKETRVVPPKFEKPMEKKVEEVVMKPSAICCYVQEELEYPDINGLYNEGIVGVEFTVETDGTLSHFIVSNPVSSELDNAVINCLKATNGMWIPGKVDDQFTPMQKLVYVKFDIPGNPSHTEMAEYYYLQGTGLYQKALAHKEEITKARWQRKAKREFNRTQNALNDAMRYCPEDPSIVFWQAATYEQQGNMEMMRKKLNRFIEIVDATGYRRVPEEELELAVIIKK